MNSVAYENKLKEKENLIEKQEYLKKIIPCYKKVIRDLEKINNKTKSIFIENDLKMSNQLKIIIYDYKERIDENTDRIKTIDKLNAKEE